MAKATKVLDKINDHQGTDWYSEKQIYDLLQHYVGSDHIHIFQALSTKDQLSYQLSQLPQLNKPQHIVPLNVSALTGELGKNTNHWVGLHIQLNNSNKSVTVNYINPMGHHINDGVRDTIKQALSPLFTAVTIEQPLLKQAIQIARQVSAIEFDGNLNDCGPMLVYIMACRVRAIDPVKISSQVESESLGTFLRKSFANQENFNAIYATLCKNPGNRAAPETKIVAISNDSDSNYSQAGKVKEKFNKKPVENKLSIDDINREQPAETPFTDTFKKMHRQYQKGNEQLRQQYKDKLWQEVITNLSKNKEELMKIFLQITDSSVKIAETAIPELKLYYYNDAASACHYVLKIAKDDFSKTAAHKKLNIIQNNIVKLCGVNPDVLKPITGQADIDKLCHRGELQALRDLTRKNLKELEEAKEKNEKLYIDKTATLFKTIASGMEQYLAGLYKEAESILGQVPCKYTVIGFGSMALRQTTPYSDLECAILTENDNYRQSGDHLIQNYFKNLSHLVHFMVINLGETIIPKSRYKLDLSEFIPQAVNFDLGGKTPLGRIEQDKPYGLVQTVEGMLRYLRNEDKKTEHMDKNLPNILQKTCFVYGDQTLADSYQNQAEEFLLQLGESGRPNCGVRAVKVLSEGVCEFDYTKALTSSKLIKGDLELFGFNPYEAEGKLFDVKQEIYRLPDRLVYYLGLIHGVQGESSWDTLDRLYELGKISAEGTRNLKKALTFATNLRLKTYDHYGYQKETMDFSKVYRQNLAESEELIEVISGTFKLKKEDLRPDGALFEYYKIVLPLHKKLEEFCAEKDMESKDSFFANEVFYSNSLRTLAKIHFRLLQHEAFLEQELLNLEELKTTLGLEHPAVALSLNSVGYTYGNLGKHEQALEYHLRALAMREKLLGMEHPDVAQSLNNVGATYDTLGKHEQALEYKLKALAILEKLLGVEHPYVAHSLNNVGFNYGGLGKHEQALVYYLKALTMREKLLGMEHPYVAQSLSNVGHTYGELGKHEQALEYNLKAMAMREELLGIEHPDVAASLNNVGYTYGNLGQHEQALEYQLKALELGKKLLGITHPNVVTFQQNIKFTLYALELKSDHEATLVMELGKEYYLKGQYLEANEEFKKVLNLPYLENNIKISLFYNLARAYHQNKYPAQAMDCYNKVLELNPSHVKVLGYMKELRADPASSTIPPKNNVDSNLTDDQLDALAKSTTSSQTILKATHPNVITFQQNLKITEELSQIETKIMKEFNSLKKLKNENSDAEIKISTKGLKKEDIKQYCKTKFGSKFPELEFDGNDCYLTLDKRCREILRDQPAPKEIMSNTADTIQLSKDLTQTIPLQKPPVTIEIESYITKCISEGSAFIEGTNLLIEKEKNAATIKWCNVTNGQNTMEENIILFKLAEVAKSSIIYMDVSNVQQASQKSSTSSSEEDDVKPQKVCNLAGSYENREEVDMIGHILQEPVSSDPGSLS